MGLDCRDNVTSVRAAEVAARREHEKADQQDVERVSRALEQAGVAAEDVELVIMATSSPDDLFGDAACVARSIGAQSAVAFDLTAACSGFLFVASFAVFASARCVPPSVAADKSCIAKPASRSAPLTALVVVRICSLSATSDGTERCMCSQT